MKSSIDTGHTADMAREELCRHLAALLQAGSNHVRVRLHRQEESTNEASFYLHEHNHWKKQEPGLTAADVVTALEAELEMLASRGKCDEFSIRKAVFADGTDFDLQFRGESLQSHPSATLEASLYGILFRDAHASGNDARRHIRKPYTGR